MTCALVAAALLGAVPRPALPGHESRTPACARRLGRLRGGADDGGEDLADSLLHLKSLLATLKDKVGSEPAPGAPSTAPAAVVEPQLGDRVRVRPDVSEPKYEWGDAAPGAVGRLTWFAGDRCLVDFPTQARWIGQLSEMERVRSGAELPAVGDRVRVRRSVSEPSYGWGHSVSHESVGVVSALVYDADHEHREAAVVRFPRFHNWTCALDELELVTRAAPDRAAAAGGAGAAAKGGARDPFNSLPTDLPPDVRDELKGRSGGAAAASGGGLGAGAGGGGALPGIAGAPQPSLSMLVGWAAGAISAKLPPAAPARGGRARAAPGEADEADAKGEPTGAAARAAAAAASGGRGGGRRSGHDRAKQNEMGAGAGAGAEAEGEAEGEGEGEGKAGGELGAEIEGESEEQARERRRELRRRLGASALLVVGKRLARALSIAVSMGAVVGLLLAALAIVYDVPMSAILDGALAALPTALVLGSSLGASPSVAHGAAAAGGLRAAAGAGRMPGLVLPKQARTALLWLIRVVPVALSTSFLYLLLLSSAVPATLLRARDGFELGFRQNARGSNAQERSGATADGRDDRLAAVLASWTHAVRLLQASRLAVLGIGGLALFEHVLRAVAAPLAPLAPPPINLNGVPHMPHMPLGRPAGEACAPAA